MFHSSSETFHKCKECCVPLLNLTTSGLSVGEQPVGWSPGAKGVQSASTSLCYFDYLPVLENVCSGVPHGNKDDCPPSRTFSFHLCPLLNEWAQTAFLSAPKGCCVLSQNPECENSVRKQTKKSHLIFILVQVWSFTVCITVYTCQIMDRV